MAKKVSAPVWWKNTFFWFGGILVVLGIVGLIGGEEIIRDPGQVREGGLVLIFVCAGLVMLVNGWLTHRQSIQHFEEGEG